MIQVNVRANTLWQLASRACCWTVDSSVPTRPTIGVPFADEMEGNNFARRSSNDEKACECGGVSHGICRGVGRCVPAGRALGAQAGEAEAKSLLKAMSDYMAAQNNISFDFDTNFEVVTKEQQKLLLASSGTINLSRPDKNPRHSFRRLCQCRADV